MIRFSPTDKMAGKFYRIAVKCSSVNLSGIVKSTCIGKQFFLFAEKMNILGPLLSHFFVEPHL